MLKSSLRKDLRFDVKFQGCSGRDSFQHTVFNAPVVEKVYRLSQNLYTVSREAPGIGACTLYN